MGQVLPCLKGMLTLQRLDANDPQFTLRFKISVFYSVTPGEDLLSGLH